MGLRWQDWPSQVLAALRKGVVIPAHPLALDADRKLDPRRQRALTRYYLDAGAGGLAVGVHTTQFAIREAGLYRPVLELAMRGAAEWAHAAAGHDRRPRRPHRAGGEGGADRARARLSRRPALARRAEGRERGRADRARAGGRRAKSRWSASTCSRPSAASCCRCRSGAASRRSRTWSPSRSRRSTATARSTWCAAWSRPAPPTASRSTPAMTTTSCSTC